MFATMPAPTTAAQLGAFPFRITIVGGVAAPHRKALERTIDGLFGPETSVHISPMTKVKGEHRYEGAFRAIVVADDAVAARGLVTQALAAYPEWTAVDEGTSEPFAAPMPQATQATQGAAGARRESLTQSLVLADVFQVVEGRGVLNDRYRPAFRFHRVEGGALLLRRAIFDRIRLATKDELMALPFEARKKMFDLLKGEAERYYGTAKRARDSEYGKRGDALPQLEFPSKVEAVAYREAFQGASKTLRAAVFGAAAEVTATAEDLAHA